MSGSDVLNSEQLSLFDVTPFTKPAPRMDYDPGQWANRPDIMYHSSHEQTMPPEIAGGGHGYGPGFHLGTFATAESRGEQSAGGRYAERPFIHPVRLSGQTALRPETAEYTRPSYPGDIHPKKVVKPVPPGSEEHPTTFDDWDAGYEIGTNLVKQGLNVPYTNVAEGVTHNEEGDQIRPVSIRAPRANISSWAEDVLSDPGASRAHQVLAEQFDVTIPISKNRKATPWALGRTKMVKRA